MPRYSLVRPDDNIDRLSSSVDPEVQTKTGWRWLLCEPVAKPSFDPTAEKITGPTYTVGASSVTEVWTKVSLTAQEIDDSKVSAVTSINGTWSPLLKIFYDVDRRLRVIEAAPSITFAQFKNGLKNRL